MKNLIISFRSRDEVYAFTRILKLNNINNQIINTPSNIGSSCALSIRVEFLYFKSISNLIQKLKPKTFLGIYSTSLTTNGNQTIKLM